MTLRAHTPGRQRVRLNLTAEAALLTARLLGWFIPCPAPLVFSILCSHGLQATSLKLPSSSLWASPIHSHLLNQSSEELALPGWTSFPLLSLHSWLVPGNPWLGLSLYKSKCCSCSSQDYMEHEPGVGGSSLIYKQGFLTMK